MPGRDELLCLEGLVTVRWELTPPEKETLEARRAPC